MWTDSKAIFTQIPNTSKLTEPQYCIFLNNAYIKSMPKNEDQLRFEGCRKGGDHFTSRKILNDVIGGTI